MPSLERLEGGRERMDEPDVDPPALDRALDHLAGINRWLGARRALLRHLPTAIQRGSDPVSSTSAIRILDVGTGGADLPAAVVRWGRREGRLLDLTAVDQHPTTLRLARRRTADLPELRLVGATGHRLPFADASFDLALLSMTLHHADGEEQVGLLRELARVARGGRVLVGELERALLHYLGARLLAATLWRSNPVTRHDAPVSVLRAFTVDELRALARAAGLSRIRVHRHFFYRLVLLADA